MGEGLRRAALYALCSRGPWKTPDGEVTGEQVLALYDGIAAGYADPWRVARLGLRGARTTDRALQLLRRARLIRCIGGRWKVSDAQ